jgi:hypothetical protein
LPDWNTRLCLNIPSFGESNGMRAMRGGNPKGSDMLFRFLHRIKDRSCDKKSTKRIAVPCQGNSKTNVLNWQGAGGTSGQVGPFGDTGILHAEGVFLDCLLTFRGMIL